MDSRTRRPKDPNRGWAAILVGLCFLPCSSRAADDAKPAASDAAEKTVFGIVKALAKSRPFRPEKVGPLTGLTFVRDADSSNDYFDLFRSTKSKNLLFSEGELRLPRKTGRKTSLLVVNLNETSCIQLHAVMGEFGTNHVFHPPSPHQIHDRQIGYSYRQPWGSLSFFFAESGGACLRSFVLDTRK